jgi:hypothetical protein
MEQECHSEVNSKMNYMVYSHKSKDTSRSNELLHKQLPAANTDSVEPVAANINTSTVLGWCHEE